jgi:hypothetical protein
VAANLASITEPATLEEALSSPDADLWRRAMDEEMASLLANNTWTLEKTPPGIKPIPVKWVFKIKRDATATSSATRRAWWPRASGSARASTTMRSSHR